MKRLLYILALGTILSSCEREKGYEGPSLIDQFGDFSVIDSLQVTNTNVAFAAGETSVFNAEFTDRANIAFSTPHCLEIMDSKVSKGHALQAIAEMAGYTVKDCIAFGDGMNDFEMLSMAGKGLVMGTAHHKVKSALPNIEVIGNCDDQAVAHYIAKHLVNKT